MVRPPGGGWAWVRSLKLHLPLVEGEMVNCGGDREIGVQEHASEGGTEGCPSGTACPVVQCAKAQKPGRGGSPR